MHKPRVWWPSTCAYKVRMRARVFGVCGSTSAMQEDVLFCAWSKIQIQ